MLRWVAFVVLLACDSGKSSPPKPAPSALPPVAAKPAPPTDPWVEARLEMVDKTIVRRGITDERVIDAMRITPRHEFVPPDIRQRAYDDTALPIGFDKTISQAFIVATMTEAARIKAGDKVLEIGTGSGYQAAVLATLGAKVYTIEIMPELAKRTQQVLDKLGYRDVHLKVGDGYYGWPEQAPFDAILVTCAAATVPKPLLAQLKTGGKLVMPIGETDQALDVLTKTDHGMQSDELMGVMFGRMLGAVEHER